MIIPLVLLINGIAVVICSRLAKSSYNSMKDSVTNSTKRLTSGGGAGKYSPMSLEGEKPKMNGPIGAFGRVGKAVWDRTPNEIKVALGIGGVAAGVTAAVGGFAAGTVENYVARPALRQLTKPVKFIGQKIYSSRAGQMAAVVGNRVVNTGKTIKKGAKAVGDAVVGAKNAVGNVIGDIEYNTAFGTVSRAGIGLAGAALGGLGLSKLIAKKTNARHNGRLEVTGATGGGYGIGNNNNDEIWKNAEKRYLDTKKSISNLVLGLAYLMRDYNRELTKELKDSVDQIRTELRANSKVQEEIRERMVNDIAEKLPESLMKSRNKKDNDKFVDGLSKKMLQRYNLLLAKNSATKRAKNDIESEDKKVVEGKLKKLIGDNTTIRENYRTYIATYKPKNKEEEEAIYDDIIANMTKDMDGEEATAILGKHKEEIKHQVEEAKMKMEEDRNQRIAQRAGEIENPVIMEYMRNNPEIQSIQEAKDAIKSFEEEKAYKESLEYIMATVGSDKNESSIKNKDNGSIEVENLSVNNDNPIIYNGNNKRGAKASTRKKRAGDKHPGPIDNPNSFN